MKKIYVIIIGLALLAGSCSDFTEIDPKGKNVLNPNRSLGFPSVVWQ